MSQITKIDYEDKINVVAIRVRKEQVVAEDMNMIKSITNQCVDGVNWIKSDELPLNAGVNAVAFLAPYPVGVPFGIVLHTCTNSKGYQVAHKISNKSVSGFDVTVSEACTFTYLAVPKR